MKYGKHSMLLLMLSFSFFVLIIVPISESITNNNIEKIYNDNSEISMKTVKNKISENNIVEEDLIFSNLSLSVKLNEASSIIEGNLSIDYYNNDPVAFDRIPFHLYPSGMDYVNRQGNISVSNVFTIGSSSDVLTYQILSDQQLMWIDLPSSLQPNQNISFCIDFQTTLPDGQDRSNSYGFDSNQSRIYTCSAFYPIPCVYDEYDGWNIDPYIHIGDPFYFDSANYDLIVEVPKEMVIAATGELLGSTSDGATTTYHFNPQYPVREVVFSTSRYFRVESKITNGVNVSCFFLPHNSYLWEDDALNTATNSLILFNNSFGSYPYSTYNVVEAYGFYGGMEYPCQVQISQGIVETHPDDYEFYQELVIAHETGHQWWCHLVGNDQVDWGHLDEGLVCWSTDYYFDYYNPEWGYFENYWALDVVRTYYAINGLPSMINQSSYNFIDTFISYRHTAYTKAPVILQKLRLTIGHDKFMAGLRHFFEEKKFKIATFPDLQRSFENVTDSTLDWFFIPWFDNHYLPKYSFKNVDYNSGQEIMTITVEDLNENENPYPYSQQIRVKIMDDRRSVALFNEKVWINGTTTLNVDLEGKGDPGIVILVYESDVLVQLSPNQNPELVYNYSDIELKTLLVNLVELSVLILAVAVGVAYIIRIERRNRQRQPIKEFRKEDLIR